MIRIATIDDWALIEHLAHEFDPYGAQYVAVFNSMLNGNWGGLPPHVQGQQFEFFIAEKKGVGKPLGFVAVGWLTPKQQIDETRVEIHGIVTGIEFRRQGVANCLMDHVMEQANARGVRRIECITTQDDNPAALHFFTQRGFVNLGPAGNYPQGQRAVRLRHELNMARLTREVVERFYEDADCGLDSRLLKGYTTMDLEAAKALVDGYHRYCERPAKDPDPESFDEWDLLDLDAAFEPQEPDGFSLKFDDMGGHYNLALDGIQQLPPGAAAILGDFNNGSFGFSLESLLEVTTPDLGFLAKIRGGLYLNGLKTLSTEGSEALSVHHGNLSLNGLEELSVAAARNLARKPFGSMSLNGLVKLGKETAEALAQIKGRYLLLNGLKELEVDAAEALARWEGRSLQLNGLKELEVDAAEALARWEGGSLQLNGLEELEVHAAEALARYKGGSLQLNGLKELSLDVAEALEKAAASAIGLGGLKKLPFGVAKAIARWNCGSIFLSRLEKLSKDEAEELARGPDNHLDLSGLKYLDIDVAIALAQFKGSLTLNLQRLDDNAAEALSCHAGECLEIFIYEKISPEAARHLAKYRQVLILLGMGAQSSIEDEGIETILANFAGSCLNLLSLIVRPKSVLRSKTNINCGP